MSFPYPSYVLCKDQLPSNVMLLENGDVTTKELVHDDGTEIIGYWDNCIMEEYSDLDYIKITIYPVSHEYWMSIVDEHILI